MPAPSRTFFAAAVLVAATALASSGAARMAAAQSPEAKGLAIAQEIDRRDLGFGDSRVTMRMVLRNAQGETSTRRLWLRTLESRDPDVGDKALSYFDHPADIKGTAFLSFTRILDPDDQWLFLPALKRVKRISSENKSGPFVGSEFAYEDLTSFEVKKYRYAWLRDEACGDLQCFVVERVPLYENSGYVRQVSWVDKAEYRIWKVEFFDRKNERLKTLTQDGFRQYLGKHWRPHAMLMVNHQTGKQTALEFDAYEFRDGSSEADFDPSRLDKLR